ncbi:related to Translation initiation factor eIF-2B epsilon subunit [Melanopsichium pennsylvanicum]|uniref:Translation initiation factor eIF2B subunit epsilon n=2 Tax=Melanopsichium pennsylvanicum TaxID=63383 RepID=A0AAJ5C816_9BASI|nr:related to Translation initiation factor eIF-2B epsilon subunit [Melanopsichium pennsylvanicum 4]SNX87525.1 related to Translation initiation factor eIF-2B epsilon subunit [Melanopsichium pennsylvanicum]
MPSKQAGKGGAKAGGASSKAKSQQNKEEDLQREPLQAVILADAFSKRLDPLTTDKPACLLPLCNVPLLDWTLENLALAEVEEIIILASRHWDLIKKHLSTSPARYSLPKITVIATPDAQSLGDVMRELDSKQIIRSDFILIHADSVASMDLASIVDAHKRRRKKDKDAIMTICTMPVGKYSRIRTPGNFSLFFVEPHTSQLIHYAPVRAAPRLKATSIPLEVFDEDAAATTSSLSRGAEIDIRNDLVDCGIDICSADVPPLFSENFDYQTLRRDFVLGILTSDLLDSKIFVHVAPTGPPASAVPIASSSFPETLGTSTYGRGYAARVKSPADYDAISKDVIGQWTYPLGPAGYLPGGQRYSPRPGLRFLGDNVVLSRTCQLGTHTLVGCASEIGEKASLHQSVLGSSVKVGSRTSITGSYIWANTIIGIGCTIERSIIGENVKILDGVKISKGCIIADGCVIGPNVELGAFSRVAKKKFKSEFNSESESEDEEHNISRQATAAAGKDASSKELGAQSIGFLWPALGEKPIRAEGEIGSEASDEEDEDEVDEIEQSRNLRLMRLGADLDDLRLSEAISDVSSIGIGGESDDDDAEDGSEVGSDGSISSDDDALGESMMLDGETNVEKQAAVRRLDEFRVEATASLERAFEENHTVDDAAIELKTLRMASNVPLKEVRKTVIGFIFTKCEPDRPKEMLKLLDKWCPLISVVAVDDQIEALATAQNFCATHAKYYKTFVPLLKKFYNDDIISEENIIGWWKSPLSRKTEPEIGGEKNLSLRKSAEEVIRHILESQESSDDDDYDDEDEDLE